MVMKLLGTSSAFFCLMLVGLCGNLHAQVSSSGTDYWLGFMPNGDPGTTDVREELFIASATANTVTIDLLGIGTRIITIGAGQVADEDVSGSITSIPETPTTNAIHITSTNPIAVYGYSDWTNNEPGSIGGSPDGYLGLPTTAYGTKYYTVNFPDNLVFGHCPGEFLVISPYDSNVVTIAPAARTKTGRFPKAPWSVTLAKGQTYLVQSPGTNQGQNDLTGSLITSTKPISVLTGHQITSVPSVGATSADYLIEMAPSVDKWGTQYFDMPMAGHPKSGDYIRVVSGEDSNQITYNGNGPLLLNSGQYHDLPQQTVPMVFTSTNGKPFIVAQYSYSQGYNNDSGASDPWMLLFTPQEQFETSMMFRTPTPSHDTFTNYVTFVSQNASLSQITVNGQLVGSYQIAGQASFPNTNPPMGAITIILPSSTRNFTASGPAPFGAYQYGFSDFEGYGWPAGMSQKEVACSATLSETNPVHFCAGDSKTIYAFPTGLSYQWERNDSLLANVADSLTVTESGTYQVIITSAKGCLDSASVHATKDPPPQASIIPGDSLAELCSGSSLTLSASGGISYLWNTGDTTSSITVSNNGSYFVTVADSNGCSATSNAVVATVLPMPDYTVMPLGDTAICADSGMLFVRQIHLHNNLGVSQKLFTHLNSSAFFGIPSTIVLGPGADSVITDSLISDGTGQLYATTCYFQDTCGLLVDSASLRVDALDSRQPITLDLPASGVGVVPGDTVGIPLHLSWIWSCVSKLHFAVRYESQMIKRLPLPSSEISLNSSSASGQTITDFYSLLPNADTGTIGELLFESFLTLQDSTPLTLSILNYGDSCLPCITSAATGGSSVRIIFGCGDRTLQSFMANGMILIGRIVPNPAVGEFTASFQKPNGWPIHYEIADALGRILASGETEQNTLSLSTRDLPSGMLILRAETGGFAQARPFVVLK